MCMKKKRIPGLKGYQTKTLQTDRQVQITQGEATLLKKILPNGISEYLFSNG